MKKYLVILYHAISICFFLIEPATAGPVVAAFTAIGTFIGTSALGGIVAKALLYVAVSIGGSLLQKALQKKPKTDQQVQGIDLELKFGDDVPFSFPLGRTAVAGRRKYAGSWGTVQKTPNAYFVDVVEISSMPTAMGAFWVNDAIVTILFAEPHADGRGYPVQQYRRDGVDYMWVRFYDGTQTVADPYLVAKFGTSARPWSNTMIGRRCAYAIITCRFKQEVYNNGLPSWLFEPVGVKVYDLRKDSSVGGSGTHRWNDPTTWEPSVNNAVCIYNIIRGIYDGTEWITGGRNLAAHRLPASNWMAAANECDRNIALSIGSPEPQYRGGLEITINTVPLAVIDEFRKGCNARITEAGGIFKILVGAPGSFVYSFTDGNVIITESQSFEPFPGLDNTFNGAEATYPEPIEKWASKDAPPLYMSTYEAADGQRRLASGLTLTAVPYPNQVQRLMRSIIEDNRKFRVHQFYLQPEATPLEPNDVISWTSTINGYVNKLFVITTLVRVTAGLVLVTIREMDPSDYDWNTSFELPTSVGFVGEIVAPPQPVFGFQVFPANITDGVNAARRPSIGFTVAQDLDDVTFIWIQVRVAATQKIIFDNASIKYETPFAWTLNGTFTPNTAYEVRIRYLTNSARTTEWSDWIAVTTDNILLGDLDVFLPGLTDQITNLITGHLVFVSDGLRFHQETIERLESLMAENGAQSYLDLISVTKKVGSARADYNQKIIVVATANEANAARIETVTAQFNNNIAEINDTISVQATAIQTVADSVQTVSAQFGNLSANGLFRVQAVAAMNGSQTTIALSAAATDSAGTTTSAGLFLTARSDGASDVIVNSGRFIISNLSAAEYPFIFSDGVLTMNATRVNLIEAGLIRGLNQRVNFDLNNSRLTMSDNT